VPRRIESHLVLFDCITCYKCIPVCPNDANFVYECEAVHVTYRDLEVDTNLAVRETGPAKEFKLERREQIANFADYCNHCGNCDTFCPEYDGPYLMKPSLFGSRAAFDAAADHDGFLVERALEDNVLTLRLLGRIEGQLLSLRELADQQNYEFSDGVVCLRIQQTGEVELITVNDSTRLPHIVDLGRFLACRALWKGISSQDRIHAVNVPWLCK
jgi:ferredoxin